MSIYTDQIEALDIRIFEAIPSQTTEGDRRSLLAVHRATAKTHRQFNYLEIGSYLGGSIQPYLLNDRCKRIYSIDPRPRHQPDDRSPGFMASYDDNSSETMLEMLGRIGYGDLSKVECIDSDASGTDPSRIQNVPEIAFIDGEHTKAAVLSDFRFCERVISPSGTIVFHDFAIIYPAILDACKELREKGRKFVALKLEDAVFAIFFDEEKIRQDPYLASQYRRNRHFIPVYLLWAGLKKALPSPVLRAVQSLRKSFGR